MDNQTSRTNVSWTTVYPNLGLVYPGSDLELVYSGSDLGVVYPGSRTSTLTVDDLNFEFLLRPGC